MEFIWFFFPFVSEKDENCSKEKAWDEEVTRGVEKLPRAPMCLLSVICHHYNYNTKSARLHASTTDIIPKHCALCLPTTSLWKLVGHRLEMSAGELDAKISTICFKSNTGRFLHYWLLMIWCYQSWQWSIIFTWHFYLAVLLQMQNRLYLLDKNHP